MPRIVDTLGLGTSLARELAMGLTLVSLAGSGLVGNGLALRRYEPRGTSALQLKVTANTCILCPGTSEPGSLRTMTVWSLNALNYMCRLTT